MNKLFKRISIILAAALVTVSLLFGFAACKDKNAVELNFLEENVVEDKYDNYYEIFVYSFCDSNGDKYGDLNGVTQKLDYIRDMGYTGIWLMPINPCESYHGYNVTDYKAVNPIYGTLDDYKNLLSAAHEKGIKVIIDLVVNHSSSNHPWFKSALAYKQGNGGDSKYAEYYNWSYTQKSGYSKNGNIWYEANFDAGMPDLNLESDAVKAEIDDIMKFWLDMGTDGFRLDGCKHYCSTTEKSVEFCKWLNEAAAKHNENVYIVGENWSNRSSIQQYYTSGIDSFFYFDTTGNVQSAITTNSPDELWVSMRNVLKAADGGIPAPFLSNHDNGVGRIAGRMARDKDKIKFAYGLLSMYPGNTFTYYGDEIGMVSKNAQSDPDIRVGMLWDNNKTNMPKTPPGASKEQEYIFDGVAEQLEDESSIINYYKLCNNTRNAFPAIMRGEQTRLSVENFNVLAFKRTYDGQTVTVVINLGTEGAEVANIEGELAQKICVSSKIKKSGTTLKMPAYSIAILT